MQTSFHAFLVNVQYFISFVLNYVQYLSIRQRYLKIFFLNLNGCYDAPAATTTVTENRHVIGMYVIRLFTKEF